MGHWPIESSNLSLSATPTVSTPRRARIASNVDASRLFAAVGLTVWIGGLVGAVLLVSRRMRFPKSMYAGVAGPPPGWIGVISGLIAFAGTSYAFPNVVWWFNVVATGLVTYMLAVYVLALTVERRRAARLGLPEPGTEGTISLAELVVFMAVAVPCAVGALALAVYGVVNVLGGHRDEGGAALGIGALALVMALFMGIFGSPLLIMLREATRSAKR
jgi:hypothetical protein